MDRYERILSDIRAKTDGGQLQWKFTRVGAYADLVVNDERVVRAFLADYALGSQVYQLLLVEKKSDFYDEFRSNFQRLTFEVYVIDGAGDLVLLLRDGLVDRDELAQLAAEVAGSNDKAASFFKAFEEYEAV